METATIRIPEDKRDLLKAVAFARIPSPEERLF
jgi:hypothetical protein